MNRFAPVAMLLAAVSVLSVGVFAWAQEKKAEESERPVKEADVPKAALEALKKLAGGAAFTELEEETENGQKYYEASWKGPDGEVEASVTAAGDVIELEESITAEKAPAAVRNAAEKAAGKDARISWEKTTLYLYEIEFKKDGKGREILFTADGRRFHEEDDDDQNEDDEHQKK